MCWFKYGVFVTEDSVCSLPRYRLWERRFLKWQKSPEKFTHIHTHTHFCSYTKLTFWQVKFLPYFANLGQWLFSREWTYLPQRHYHKKKLLCSCSYFQQSASWMEVMFQRESADISIIFWEHWPWACAWAWFTDCRGRNSSATQPS